MNDIIVTSLGVKALDSPLNLTLLESGFGRNPGIDRKYDAPDAPLVIPWNLEQRAPFIGIGDIVGHRVSVLPEVVTRAENEKSLLIGESGEHHRHGFAHLAASAIAADHPASAKHLFAAGRCHGG